MDPKILKNIQQSFNSNNSKSSRHSRKMSVYSLGNCSKASKIFGLSEKGSFNNGTIKNASVQRKQKLNNLEIEYHKYLEQSQGMFVVNCQMMNSEFKTILEQYDLEQQILDFPNFSRLQKEIAQEKIFKRTKTLVIDIENTLLTATEVLTKDDLEQIKQHENFKENYIVIKKIIKKSADNEFCCIYQGTTDCVCNLIVFKIRPYTFELLRALQPFFEIIVFS